MKKIGSMLGVKGNLNKLLNEEFDEALKDDTFKMLAAKTKLKREVLIKYTSSLKECAFELADCKGCPGLAACPHKVNGYVYFPRVSSGYLEFSYKPCKYKLKESKQNQFRKNVVIYNVPKDIQEATLKKVYKTDKKRIATISWLTEFMTQYKKNSHQKGLFLSGNFGSGKTYLISAMFNEMAKDGVKSAIIFWPEYLRDLKGSFNSEYKNEFNNKFNNIKKAPLLLIDDLGAESVTPWSRDEILCPILQYRMDEKLPTFFTSNLTLDALETHLAITSKGDEVVKAGRIISRIKQLSEYQEMISKNLRK